MSYFAEGETLLQFVTKCTTNTTKMCAGTSPKPLDLPTEISSAEFIAEVLVGDGSRKILYLHIYDANNINCVYKIDFVVDHWNGLWKKQLWAAIS